MVNPTFNAILEYIHQVLGNLSRNYNIKETYVDKDEHWSGILAAAEFAIISTENRLKGYSPGQLVFSREIILPIKYTVDWELIHQWKQIKINKNSIRKNSKIVERNYKVRNKVILNNNDVLRYETPYKVPFELSGVGTITQSHYSVVQ